MVSLFKASLHKFPMVQPRPLSLILLTGLSFLATKKKKYKRGCRIGEKVYVLGDICSECRVGTTECSVIHTLSLSQFLFHRQTSADAVEASRPSET